MKKSLQLLIAVVVLASPWPLATVAVAASAYSIQALPLPANLNFPSVQGINDVGQVLGKTLPAFSSATLAVLWTNGEPTVLPTLGGRFGMRPASLNNAGVVVGSGSTLLRFEPFHAFRWTASEGISDIHVGTGSSRSGAVGVDDAGTIVVESPDVPTSTGYLWSNGAHTFLPSLPGYRSVRPVASSESGVIAALAREEVTLVNHPVVYVNGNVRFLLGNGTPTAVNNDGQSVGESSDNGDPRGYPVFWDSDGTRHFLTLPPGTNGYRFGALAINQAGEIVGTINGPQGWTAVYWASANTPGIVLNSTLSAVDAAQWHLSEASAINELGQIAGVGLLNGVNTPFVLTRKVAPLVTMELFAADRDDPFVPWSAAVAVTDARPVYAGDRSAGDLVGWRVNGAPANAEFNWSAVQISGLLNQQTIAGPRGTDEREWRFTNGSFDWAPGEYEIRCEITPVVGEPIVVVGSRVVGWRTQRYFVTGQVKPINDFHASFARRLIISNGLIQSYNFGDFDLANLVKQALLALPADVNVKIWSAFQFLRYDASQGAPEHVALHAVKTLDKYWMVQSLLNDFPDLVELSSTLSAEDIELLFAESSYRMYGEVQFRYLLDSRGKLDVASIKMIDAVYDNGPTKFQRAPQALVPSAVITVKGVRLDLVGNSGQTLIESEEIPRNGEMFVNAANTSVSFFFGGRIGLEGRVPNYAMLHRDAPFIFCEIVAAIGPDGRDARTKIRTSVDRTWNVDGTVTGNTHFNEIRIYRRDYRDELRRFSLVENGFFPIQGQVEGFLLSGSYDWPGMAPVPMGDN